jgi:hypothetical protein
MTDWRVNPGIKKTEAIKAAGAILGLLFALILAGWILSRFLQPASPPQEPGPAAAPATAQPQTDGASPATRSETPPGEKAP